MIFLFCYYPHLEGYCFFSPLVFLTTIFYLFLLFSAGNEQGNVLDDLREKWLEIEGEELEARDQSALAFDQRLLELKSLDCTSLDGRNRGTEFDQV